MVVTDPDDVVTITITRTIGQDADHVWLDTTGNPGPIEVIGMLEMAKALVINQSA